MNTTQTARIADLSMAWHLAATLFPYFDRLTLDWDAAYRAWLPKVAAAESAQQFHLLLAEFLNLLGDGHTDYSFPAPEGLATFLPFTLDFVGDACCIAATTDALSAFRWARVEAINGTPISTLLHDLRRYAYHVDDWIAPYPLKRLLPLYLRPQDNLLQSDCGSFRFDLSPCACENHTAGLHATDAMQPLRLAALDARRYGEHILYIRLDDFLRSHADAVREALLQCPDMRGLILDLRENVGGMTFYAAEIASLLIPGSFGACQKWTRAGRGVALASASQLAGWSPARTEEEIARGLTSRTEVERAQQYLRRCNFERYEDQYGNAQQEALYHGPCIVLTSRHTVSAAEDFLAMLRSNRRARLLGQPSAGTSGTPLLRRLSCGGRLRICSVGYRLLDGTDFIGTGIQPDLFVVPTLSDLRAGRDSLLDAALQLLR